MSYYTIQTDNVNLKYVGIFKTPPPFGAVSLPREKSVIRQKFSLFVKMVDTMNTLSYIVFRMAQSEPSSGVKGKAIYNKNLSN